MDFKQAQINHFLGNWGNWGKWPRGQVQEEELRQELNGWSNEEMDSEYSDSEWMANKRPGMHERGYSDEEAVSGAIRGHDPAICSLATRVLNGRST